MPILPCRNSILRLTAEPPSGLPARIKVVRAETNVPATGPRARPNPVADLRCRKLLFLCYKKSPNARRPPRFAGVACKGCWISTIKGVFFAPDII